MLFDAIVGRDHREIHLGFGYYSIDSLGDNDCWDFLENIIDETPSSSLLWPGNNNSGSVEIDFSCSGIVSQQNEPARKRARGGDSCSRPGAKACREKLSRERLNHREEKFTLKADKVKIEQQVKAMSVPPSSGFMQPHPATYHAGSTKMPMYPTYNLEPLWQYLPPTVYETSRDHELRPPAT
ncbi:Transcription factor bHLH104 [Linum perenne]